MTIRLYHISRLINVALIVLVLGCSSEDKYYTLDSGIYQPVGDSYLNLTGLFTPNLYGDTLYLNDDSTFTRKESDRYLLKGTYYREGNSLILRSKSRYISFLDSVDSTKYKLWYKINDDNSLYQNSYTCKDSTKLETRLKLISD